MQIAQLGEIESRDENQPGCSADGGASASGPAPIPRPVALPIDDGFASAYNRGIGLRDAGRFSEAADAFRAALRVRPENPDAHNDLGNALHGDNDLKGAIEEYERAIELKPNLFAATKSLAMLYQAKGFKNKAVEMWERSMRAAPSEEVRAEIKQYLMSLL